MADGRSKKVSQLGTVNSVSNSDLMVVVANVSGNSTTSQISVQNFVNTIVGNAAFTTVASSNTVKVAADTTPVSYFTYDRTVYAGVQLLVDFKDTANNRTFGNLRIAANSTVANAQSGVGQYVQIGANPINVVANASVSGNTVTLSFSQAGSTNNVQVRYVATYFRV